MAVLGWKVPETTSLVLFLFYTDLLTDWGRTAPQVLGQSGSYIKGIMIFIPPDCTIVFSSFFFPFSFKETECFWAVLMWHNYQCNCSFQSGCQPKYWERYIRKSNVIYSWVIFYNVLLWRCNFEWTGQACISKAYLLPPQAPTLIRLMAT